MTDEQAELALHLLRQIISDLPARRDWLDLEIERAARNLLALTSYATKPEEKWLVTVYHGSWPETFQVFDTEDEARHFFTTNEDASDLCKVIQEK